MAPSSPLTAAQLERFEARLQRERRRLLGLTDSSPDTDTPGLADAQMERSTRETLTASERSQLARVNRALSKLENGTYGLSDITGEPIPLARLEALPWATTNVEDESL